MDAKSGACERELPFPSHVVWQTYCRSPLLHWYVVTRPYCRQVVPGIPFYVVPFRSRLLGEEEMAQHRAVRCVQLRVFLSVRETTAPRRPFL